MLSTLRIVFFSLIAAIILLIPTLSHAQSVTVDLNKEKPDDSPSEDYLVVPFGYATDDDGIVFGVAGATSGFDQPQQSLGGVVRASANGTWGLVFQTLDLQLGDYDSRLFFDATVLMDHSVSSRGHTNFGPYNGIRPGSNASSNDDAVRSPQNEYLAEISLYYQLPMGTGKGERVHKYFIKDGFLENNPLGGDIWNPLESGRTTVHSTLFYQRQAYAAASQDKSISAGGIELELRHDNRDWEKDPSKGSYQAVTFKAGLDPKEGDPWNSIQVDLRKYYDLWQNDYFRKTTLALNGWLYYNPTWKEKQTSAGTVIENRAPHFMDPLGGMKKMRAYSSDRFSGKSAIYYSAELRLTPYWQPFEDTFIDKYFSIDWVQLVPFVEVGRVADEFNVSELHSNLKYDAGVDLRTLMNNFLVRIGVAVAGEDEWSVRGFVGHPF